MRGIRLGIRGKDLCKTCCYDCLGYKKTHPKVRSFQLYIQRSVSYNSKFCICSSTSFSHSTAWSVLALYGSNCPLPPCWDRTSQLIWLSIGRQLPSDVAKEQTIKYQTLTHSNFPLFKILYQLGTNILIERNRTHTNAIHSIVDLLVT